MIAVYTRVSTGVQVAQGTSLETQAERCRLKAVELGLNESDIRLYREEGFSGEDTDRPALNQLRNDVAKGLVTHVICTDPDRFSRDLTDKLVLCKDLEYAGVRLIFADEEYSDTPEGQMFLNVRAIIAQYELSLIRKRTVRGRERAVRENGITPMPQPPLGYQSEKGKLVIVPEEAEFVKLIYQWYVHDSLSIRQIAEKLISLGCYPKRGDKTYWSGSTLRRILKNEIYIGRYHYKKTRSVRKKGDKTPSGRPRKQQIARDQNEWIEVQVPAILDEKIWDSAQETMKSNTKSGEIQNEFLLRGLIICGECGRSWVKTTMRNYSKQNDPIYRCTHKHPNKYGNTPDMPCKMPSVRADHLDDALWREIQRVLSKSDRLLEYERSRICEALRSSEARIETLTNAIKKKNQEFDRLMARYISGEVGDDELALNELKRMRAEIATLNREIEAEKSALSLSSQDTDQVNIVAGIITDLRERLIHKDGEVPFSDRRYVVERLIDNVVISLRDAEAKGIQRFRLRYNGTLGYLKRIENRSRRGKRKTVDN